MTCQSGLWLANLHKFCIISGKIKPKIKFIGMWVQFFFVLDSSSCHNKHSSSYECYCFLPIFFCSGHLWEPSNCMLVMHCPDSWASRLLKVLSIKENDNGISNWRAVKSFIEAIEFFFFVWRPYRDRQPLGHFDCLTSFLQYSSLSNRRCASFIN